MTSEDFKWRNIIVDRLRERNKKEVASYSDLISYNNRLLDATYQLKAENLKLVVENDKIRSGLSTNGTGGGNANAASSASAVNVQLLEKKILAQQEELTELHKRKGENSQMIIDLNIKLTEQQKLITDKDSKLTQQLSINSSIKSEVQMLTTSIEELKNLNTMLRDEHTALQLAFASLEEKLRKVQDENRQLVDRLIKYKAKDAEKMNEENESVFKKRTEKMRRELEDAANEGNRRSSSPIIGATMGDGLLSAGLAGNFFNEGLPNGVQMKFDAHDGEVNAVVWSPIERVVVTGGADRKVKIWNVSKGTCEPRGVLVGSNAGINSVEFDSTGTMILASCNDQASRVWTAADQRLRHTLTGHSGKVLAAKFLGEHAKVVTGSHDRTLKIWDLRSRACTETKFAGSCCNDLVTSDGSGSTIISGHFDKKIRFWDTRTDCSSNDITLQGKITSLDLSKDCKLLLCCVRDDTIKLLDLRQNQIIGTFSHDNFKVGCDWARVAFSPDCSRIAAGAADGSVFLWNVAGQLEATLKDQTTASVTAVRWHPFSSTLASVDRAKKCTVWSTV